MNKIFHILNIYLMLFLLWLIPIRVQISENPYFGNTVYFPSRLPSFLFSVLLLLSLLFFLSFLFCFLLLLSLIFCFPLFFNFVLSFLLSDTFVFSFLLPSVFVFLFAFFYFFLSFYSLLFLPFLVADTRLYTLPCRSVGRSVCRSVRPSHF